MEFWTKQWANTKDQSLHYLNSLRVLWQPVELVFWHNVSLELTTALTLLLLTMWRSEDETHSVEENVCHYLNHVSSERTSFNLVKSHIRPSRFSCDWKFVLWIISTPGLFQWFPAQHLAQSHPNMARGIMAEGRHHSESCHHSVYSQHQTSTSITLYKAWLQNITLYKADMWPSVAWSPACNEHHHLDLNSDLAAGARHRMFTIIERDEFWPPTFMFFVMLFFFVFVFFFVKKLQWVLSLVF